MSEQEQVETIQTPGEASPPSESPNIESMLGDISSDLFGAKAEEKEEVVSEARQDKVVDKVLAPSSPDPAAQPEEEVKPEEEIKAEEPTKKPDGWRAEALAEFDSLSETVKAEILKREEDFHRGLESYKERASVGDDFITLMKPYEQVLQSQNVDPRTLVQSFAGNHYLLTYGTPEQKTQLAAQLISSYGVDLVSLVDLLAGNQANQPSPEVRQLNAKIAQLEARFQQEDSARQQALYNDTASQVEAFAKDHPYFDELSIDIEKFIRTGATLQEAYDKALWSNPTTRQKELDRLASQKSSASSEAKRLESIAKAKASNVTVLPHQREGMTPLGSIDDTLSETLAAIKARG